MNWKKFKNLFAEDKASESSFIIGLDLGSASSAIAYYDMFSQRPSIIDISGGYGKPVAPTVMQYIPASKEWVFGEYALLNRGVGSEITITGIINKLGQHSFIEAGGRAVSIPNILALYLKELISNCKSLNPKAEIAGIVVAVPDFCPKDVLDEMQLAFKIAGFDKELIDFAPERLCVFNKHFMDFAPQNARAVLIDFGARSIRGALYDLSNGADGITLKNLSFLEDESIGTNRVDKAVLELFSGIFANSRDVPINSLSGQVKDQIKSFAYQHKDLLFQKNILAKPLKLYFNFSHPPFAHSLTRADADAFLQPFAKGFYDFLNRLFEKNLYDLNESLDPKSIDTVILTGGGFEMLWARNAVSDFFPDASILQKNTKDAAALGASLLAAGRLGVIDIPNIIFEDRLKLKYDFGIKAVTDNKERFIPLVERNSFWWQTAFNRRILLSEEQGGQCILPFYKRDENGEVSKVCDIGLTDLPNRSKPAGFFRLSLRFESYDSIILSISDEGFGELFENTGYRQDFRFEAQN